MRFLHISNLALLYPHGSALLAFTLRSLTFGGT